MRDKSVSKSLEEVAQSIVKTPPEDLGVGKLIRQDIALTLEHLNRHRVHHQEQLRSLLKAECYIGTELREVYHCTPKRSLEPLPDRGRLRKQLMKVEQERRKSLGAYEEGLRGLNEKLLGLVQKWDMIR